MTALGNVMALVRELQDEGFDLAVAPVSAGFVVEDMECPAETACGSSLGEVLEFIRVQGSEPLREAVAPRARSGGCCVALAA